jgi:nucleotide-binding universal stress UspA family protein
MPLIGKTPLMSLNAVIYGTDFSLSAQNAGLYAALLAKYFATKLVVAHAFTLSQAALEVEVHGELVSQQRRDLKVLLEQKVSTLAAKSMEALPILLDGDPKEALPDLAEDYKPSLMVLGTHGGGWVEREIIGSVAERILRSTRWPTMTVGPQVKPATSRTLPFRRILYATDLTTAAARAAVSAVSLARVMGAEIDVLNVIERGAVDHPERLDEISKKFYGALDAVVPGEAKEFCDPRTFVAVGDAHQRILQHIHERSADLLVLGIRKTSHLGMKTRTSGAFQLIVDSRCPVLTVTG